MPMKLFILLSAIALTGCGTKSETQKPSVSEKLEGYWVVKSLSDAQGQRQKAPIELTVFHYVGEKVQRYDSLLGWQSFDAFRLEGENLTMGEQSAVIIKRSHNEMIIQLPNHADKRSRMTLQRIDLAVHDELVEAQKSVPAYEESETAGPGKDDTFHLPEAGRLPMKLQAILTAYRSEKK